MGSYYSQDESMLHKQSHTKFKKKYDTEDNPANQIVDIKFSAHDAFLE